MRKFHPTPDMLVHCYNMLQSSPPFNKWQLPDSDEVEFQVEMNPNRLGACEVNSAGPLRIYISNRCRDTETMVQTMGHEMIHLRQRLKKGSASRREWHGRDFKTMARQVCGFHGWLPAHF